MKKSVSTSQTDEYSNWEKNTTLCLGNNDIFRAFNKQGVKICLKKSWESSTRLNEILQSPDVFLDNTESLILKDGKTVKACAVESEGDYLFFVKRYNRKGFLYILKNLFRSSRARRVWQVNYGFELRGVAAAPVIAYMEERKFRLLKRSYIINEFIPGTELLSAIFSRGSQSELLPLKLEIMQKIGHELGKMHKTGCLHGDLKWSNILVRNENSGIMCFFIDLDGSTIKKHLSESDITGDLGRFYADLIKYSLNESETRTFFESYCTAHNPAASCDELVRKVIEKSLKKYRIPS